VVSEVPSQAPPHAVPSVAQAWRPPRGAPVTGLQVPLRPVTAQDEHCPVQVESQHTPSTQMPELHWLPPPQDSPGPALGWHMPALHQFPPLQLTSLLQLPPQAVETHR
jgi:hypothetical protein